MTDDIEMKDFVFGASNFSREGLNTNITVRALCPEKDRGLLKELLCSAHVRSYMEEHRLRFGKAREVRTALGQHETLTLNPRRRDRRVDQGDPCASRVRLKLGRRSRSESNQRGHEFSTCERRQLELPSGRVQQVIVRVEAEGENQAYPVRVDHWSADGKKYIGGMTLLFVPPWDPFHGRSACGPRAGKGEKG